MEKAVELKNFSWKYRGRSGFALKNINLEIRAGECVAIVGANEQGKTTLTRCLNGLIPNSYSGVMKGSAAVYGNDIRTARHRDLARICGSVFSDPDSQFTSMSVEEELVFGLENLNLPTGKIKERLEWAVTRFRLGDILRKPPYELSGGQKQRVAVAAVAVMRPEILVLDEPTSMLDPVGKSEIFELLNELKKDRSFTLIITEHNIAETVKIARRIIFLDEGGIKFDGSVSGFINSWDYGSELIYPPEVSTLFSKMNKFSGDIPFLLADALEKAAK